MRGAWGRPRGEMAVWRWLGLLWLGAAAQAQRCTVNQWAAREPDDGALVTGCVDEEATPLLPMKALWEYEAPTATDRSVLLCSSFPPSRGSPRAARCALRCVLGLSCGLPDALSPFPFTIACVHC